MIMNCLLNTMSCVHRINNFREQIRILYTEKNYLHSVPDFINKLLKQLLKIAVAKHPVHKLLSFWVQTSILKQDNLRWGFGQCLVFPDKTVSPRGHRSQLQPWSALYSVPYQWPSHHGWPCQQHNKTSQWKKQKNYRSYWRESATTQNDPNANATNKRNQWNWLKGHF